MKKQVIGIFIAVVPSYTYNLERWCYSRVWCRLRDWMYYRTPANHVWQNGRLFVL